MDFREINLNEETLKKKAVHTYNNISSTTIMNIHTNKELTGLVALHMQNNLEKDRALIAAQHKNNMNSYHKQYYSL